jgi:predicted DNA-binding transcriptional regulator AlpA
MTNRKRFESLLTSEEAAHHLSMHVKTPPEIERPLSAAELAPIIGLHSVTILRWARERRIPHHRLSARKIVFLPSEISHWLTSGSGLYAVPVGHAA